PGARPGRREAMAGAGRSLGEGGPNPAHRLRAGIRPAEFDVGNPAVADFRQLAELALGEMADGSADTDGLAQGGDFRAARLRHAPCLPLSDRVAAKEKSRTTAES